jgi:hypothetical protein
VAATRPGGAGGYGDGNNKNQPRAPPATRTYDCDALPNGRLEAPEARAQHWNKECPHLGTCGQGKRTAGFCQSTDRPPPVWGKPRARARARASVRASLRVSASAGTRRVREHGGFLLVRHKRRKKTT